MIGNNLIFKRGSYIVTIEIQESATSDIKKMTLIVKRDLDKFLFELQKKYYYAVILMIHKL